MEVGQSLASYRRSSWAGRCATNRVAPISAAPRINGFSRPVSGQNMVIRHAVLVAHLFHVVGHLFFGLHGNDVGDAQYLLEIPNSLNGRPVSQCQHRLANLSKTKTLDFFDILVLSF